MLPPIKDSTVNNIQATLLIAALVVAFAGGSLTEFQSTSDYVIMTVTVVILIGILIIVSILEKYQRNG